jgi:hypothetical protein
VRTIKKKKLNLILTAGFVQILCIYYYLMYAFIHICAVPARLLSNAACVA